MTNVTTTKYTDIREVNDGYMFKFNTNDNVFSYSTKVGSYTNIELAIQKCLQMISKIDGYDIEKQELRSLLSQRR